MNAPPVARGPASAAFPASAFLPIRTESAEETRPQRIAFRFVLALILMRKRLLKYEETQSEDGMEIWRMRTVRPL